MHIRAEEDKVKKRAALIMRNKLIAMVAAKQAQVNSESKDQLARVEAEAESVKTD